MKLKNKFLIGALVLFFGFVESGCKKTLDINTSPLTATKVDPKLLFGYAITAWDVNKNSGDNWLPIGIMAQTIASGNDIDWFGGNAYDLNNTSLGNTWKVYYSTGGNNLKQAIKIAESSSPAANNTAAQCKIVLAQMMYEATMLYGDVPYSEAWNADQYPYPKYDAQKDVLEGIIALLNEAIGQIEPNSPLKISDYDIYYKGDMVKWKKLANSLKFKVLMVMVDKDPSKATAIGQLLANPSDMISSSAESWLHPYSGASNQENPKYRLFKTFSNNINTFLYANTAVFKYMQPKNDPRIPKFFKPGANGGYDALDADEDFTANSSLINDYLYRANAPSVIISYQEILLLEAEAYARGLGVTRNLATAQTLFKNGVEASMKFYEADASAITTYSATQLPNLLVAADPVKEIHIQEWVDLMDRSLDAFVQWRRSGSEGSEVPDLTVPPLATQGPLIRRYTLSPDELTSNPNIPTPQPKYYDKMWFDL